MAFLEAPRTLEEVAAVPERVGGPCLLNVVPGGRTPPVSAADAQAMGYRLAIYPGACLSPVVMAVDASLAKIRGAPPMAAAEGGPAALFARMGSGEWDALRRSFDAEVETAA